MPTVTLGVDAHKRSHTVVAVDAVGKKLAAKTVPSTSIGHAAALSWARVQFGVDLVWGIEDCRSMTARLERDLMAANQIVVRVPPHLMSRSRASSREPGKSDPIDALAVARAVLREPDLPRAAHDETSFSLKLLVDRRDDLVTIRRGMISRLLDRVHALDPTHVNPTNWDRAKVRADLHTWLAQHTGLIAELARAELDDIDRLTAQIVALTERLTHLINQVAPRLLAKPGVGPLSAAKIVAETAGVERFKSEAAFARYVGAAPTPNWSGGQTPTGRRLQPSRRGNRQLNSALHRIAVVQIRLKDCPGRDYVERRVAEGDTKSQAIRSLKRRLARVVYQALIEDRALTNQVAA
ncbi:IS110 family transposase (plasmid) [Mycolicibacterium crocinum]|uniref:IS110 family transposase n=1 Tax=Mycolicibacterium crocinum TaxID=388459 RepID=A0ABY3TZV5_9MYCO|nr:MULTISPECIES: IS110 family transposase [Mycolicibacterium]ULN44770.1 IS110 family transposase [Mycolicibacterium crocinum]